MDGVPWWSGSLAFGVTAVAPVRSLAQELPLAVGMAKKKEEEKEEETPRMNVQEERKTT